MQHRFSHIIFLLFSTQLVLWGCSKQPVEAPHLPGDTGPAGFTRFTIPTGAHFSTANDHFALDISEYRFQVYFDSTAVYSLPGEDQYDINKLSGFADNGGLHQQFSARIGWRWADGNLALFAFVHNNGIFEFREISTIDIGKIYTCTIRIEENEYVFTVDDPKKTVRMRRQATTATSQGYRLYPYFGGNQLAPHEINIWLKYL